MVCATQFNHGFSCLVYGICGKRGRVGRGIAVPSQLDQGAGITPGQAFPNGVERYFGGMGGMGGSSSG